MVDGGSDDRTVQKARTAGAQVLVSKRGRGRQQNLGALKARGDIILFLHADSILPDDWKAKLTEALAKNGSCWGAFDSIDVEGTSSIQNWILTNSVRLRTRLFHSPYGDQGIFVRKKIFHAVGGFPDHWALLEDVELVRRLRNSSGTPALVSSPMAISGRRWQNLGFLRTTFINQCILLGHRFGVDVNVLADMYARGKGVQMT